MYPNGRGSCVDATPEEIDAAYADEAAGRSNWRSPKVLMRTRDGRRPGEIGAIIDYRVNLNATGAMT